MFNKGKKEWMRELRWMGGGGGGWMGEWGGGVRGWVNGGGWEDE